MKSSCAALFVTAGLFAAFAFAQGGYPSRPIRLVVPWPPGQATDLSARLVAQKLSESLGQPLVVDNRPGAGGVIGSDAVAKSAPDGYTLLAGSSGPISINPIVQKVPYDPEQAFAPVGTPSETRARLAAEVRKAVQAGDLRERYAALGMDPVSSSPEDLGALLKRERERYTTIVKKANIRID